MKIVSNHVVRDVLAEKERGAFNAVFVAIGASSTAASRFRRAMRAAYFLRLTCCAGLKNGDHRDSEARDRLWWRRHCDGSCTSARRLGADEPPIVYHRDREHMKAHESEFAEALAEGVKVRWLTNINSIGDGNVLVEEMRLDEQAVRARPASPTSYSRLGRARVGRAHRYGVPRSVPEIELRDDGTSRSMKIS